MQNTVGSPQVTCNVRECNEGKNPTQGRDIDHDFGLNGSHAMRENTMGVKVPPTNQGRDIYHDFGLNELNCILFSD